VQITRELVCNSNTGNSWVDGQSDESAGCSCFGLEEIYQGDARCGRSSGIELRAAVSRPTPGSRTRFPQLKHKTVKTPQKHAIGCIEFPCGVGLTLVVNTACVSGGLGRACQKKRTALFSRFSHCDASNMQVINPTFQPDTTRLSPGIETSMALSECEHLSAYQEQERNPG